MTPHEKLVEDVASHLAASYPTPYEKVAGDIIARIFVRLHDVTPEMQGAAMMAWLDYDLPANVEYSDGQSINIWRAMLAASPLNGGK